MKEFEVIEVPIGRDVFYRVVQMVNGLYMPTDRKRYKKKFAAHIAAARMKYGV